MQKNLSFQNNQTHTKEFMQNRNINYANAINEALKIAMKKDKKMICYGLGVTDPKAVFGTTNNLENIYGKSRVFDMPTSENAMTGVAIGAALNNIRSVVTHQRLDFFLLAMDQLVNSAAKWYYMFGEKKSVPITIRLIVGRGWGQGPTHSQNLQAWFAHIPGLKVVMPSSPKDAKGLLLSSIFDPNPVIFLEHRWLHNTYENVKIKDFRIPIGKANILKKGNDLTIISMSYLTPEAIRSVKKLKKLNIDCELIDLRTVKPIDWETIFKSVKKTGRLLVLDTGFSHNSIASEIISKVASNYFNSLKTNPVKLAMPDVPEPTSVALTKNFYIGPNEIMTAALKIFKKKLAKSDKIKLPLHHDIPGDWFKGPF